MDLVSLTDLDYSVCRCIQSHLPSADVVRFASLGSSVWLAASRSVIASRIELVGKVIEIINEDESRTPRRTGVQLLEVIRSNGSAYTVREIDRFDPQKYRNTPLTDLIVKPIMCKEYSKMPNDVMLQFRNLKLVCDPFGCVGLPDFIGLEFSSLEFEFGGFQASKSEELFDTLLSSPKLTTLRFSNQRFTRNAIAALRHFILNADWESVEMEDRRAPDFLADRDLLAAIVDTWHGREKPTFRKLKLYTTITGQDAASITSLGQKWHPMLGYSCSITLSNGGWYFPVEISFAKSE